MLSVNANLAQPYSPMMLDRFYWILERLAATVVGLVSIGLGSGVIIFVVDAHRVLESPFVRAAHGCFAGFDLSNIGSDFAILVYLGIIYALVIGTFPAFVALTQSPAKTHPWRCLPLLVIGTLAGFSISLILDNVTGQDILNRLVGTIAFFALPTIAGLLTAWNIDRVPPAFRLGAQTSPMSFPPLT